MGSITGWKKTHNTPKTVRWKHRQKKTKLSVSGLSERGNHVSFQQADKVLVNVYGTSKDSMFINDMNPVTRRFKTKDDALDFAKNWMRDHSKIPGAEERTEKEKKVVRTTSVIS